ncbi:GDP-mannose 4,6-dehydratase [Agriterribacter sp.]|uniref:GDP-mannose 4,6-dehydratase n=1 Tax=Agriterribacter sp. TaxID=2821509 RepID=UPI002CD19917|nr:GDP-mannose 4,6-dehydratase [Agriterribacter sp.]HRP54961.1 GDP-mannose 4,6-dehydratase [Agriterribacter sp.]
MSKIQRALIFGSNGQDGFYLNLLLSNLGIEVINVSRTNAAICGSVSDYHFVQKLIKENIPDYIFHFAARSSTKHEFLFENHETIATGTINILESIKLFSPLTRVFISGSAMQFKNKNLPIDEATEFEASSPYSIARIHSVYAARYYIKAFRLKVYVGYFFNHDSPLRTEQHVNQKIVRAVQRIASGSTEKLILGDIEVQKEFNYAGDVVDAVWELVNQDMISEAVIGSGKAYTIKDWLELCFSLKKLQWQNYVVLQNHYIPEYRILLSNPGVIKGIGWEPKINFYQLANMMMNE